MIIVVRRALAVALAIAALWGAWEYPAANPYLLLALIGYLIALHVRLSVGMFVLPVVIPLLNLAPWSGRLLLEDFDLFVLATIGAWLWQRPPPTGAASDRARTILIGLLTLSVLIALGRGLMPMPAFDRTALSDYYSHFNSLRAAKGFLLALALTPLLRQQLSVPNAPGRLYFFWGAIVGATGNAIVILWERGVVRDLLHARNRYELVGSLLDFSTLYRVTAMFSEMHTGGEALDGYLTLVWPCALGFLVLYRHRPFFLAIGGLALVGTTYSVLVTYTRTTYLAVAASLVTFAITLVWSRGRRLPLSNLFESAALLVATLGAAVYGFLKGGTVTLVASLLAFSGGAIISLAARRLPRVVSTAAFAIAGAFGVYAAARGMLRSKWVQTPMLESLLIALGLSVGLLLIGVRLHRRTSDVVRPQIFAMFLLLFVGGAALATQVVAGYRVRDRLATVGTDLSTRGHHWQDVLGSMQPDAWTTALGMGLGRFQDAYRLSPQTYRRTVLQLDRMEGYSLLNDGTRTFVRFHSAPYLGLGQRITLRPNSSYRLSLEVRTNVPLYRVAVSLEYRNIILSEGYNPTRKNFAFTVERSDGGWRRVEMPIDTGPLGTEAWYERWPIVILIGERSTSSMDVTNVAVIDSAGHNLIQNGSFERAGDHWFAYDDFDHLPWHIKNIGLATYFEQGALGVIAFLAFVVFSLVRSVQWVRRDETLAPALTAAIVGGVTVGIAGNPLDAPRVAFLFYALLFVASSTQIIDVSQTRENAAV